MKIQITATVSSDGYLLPPDTIKRRWPFEGKHSLSALRKKADMLLHTNDSLLLLLAEKRKACDASIYLAEATPQTADLIKGLLLYHLADELIVYTSPAEVGKGYAFSELVDTKEWEMQAEHSLSGRAVCRIYSRKGR
ncbi:hypothetical protein [Parabacteroides timonensis]|uniref:hypothetical protein n=1 Tax=Parabacteroides timonensis TaxID=1871013 RepID=UPI00094E1D30|nr:hypothetical protein [Parabacteroides timonensis]